MCGGEWGGQRGRTHVVKGQSLASRSFKGFDIGYLNGKTVHCPGVLKLRRETGYLVSLEDLSRLCVNKKDMRLRSGEGRMTQRVVAQRTTPGGSINT